MSNKKCNCNYKNNYQITLHLKLLFKNVYVYVINHKLNLFYKQSERVKKLSTFYHDNVLLH